VQRREDEGAELGHVDHVAEERACLGVGEDGRVDGRVVRRGDDEVAAVEIGAPVRAPQHLDRRAAISGETSGATTVTAAPQSRSPRTFSCATRPAPTTRTLRSSRSMQAT
jgi:hypothetical protein